ncbi:PAAR domain-containing protein [Streptomyces sp. NPDC001262]|uniref:PAAR domain-containing protein n=1 Tax=Streptomyces sp. NPDC001262 TaxID=3364552 RepID=UPI003696B703
MPPAARAGDAMSHIPNPGPVPVPAGTGAVAPPGMPNVLVGGLPVAVAPGLALCAVPHGPTPLPPAPVIPTPMPRPVFVGGRPVLRMGDKLPCGAAIVGGCATVVIGG